MDVRSGVKCGSLLICILIGVGVCELPNMASVQQPSTALLKGYTAEGAPALTVTDLESRHDHRPTGSSVAG